MEYVRQLRGPLAQIPLLASGGVTAALGAECLRAGCRALGVGLALFGIDIAQPLDPAAVQAAGSRYVTTVGADLADVGPGRPDPTTHPTQSGPR